MRRLTLHLARQFATDALILFCVVSFLLWLVQCLRVFDVVSVKGQSLATLGLQGLLTMPPLVLTFAFVCVGIGLSRALTALQANHELHIIHSSGGLGNLLRAAGLTGAVGALVVLAISNFLAPYAERQLQALNASITADLVSSTLVPGRFTQATPGVVMLIGGRAGGGEITEFFADDRRDPAVRRTYVAESATVFRVSDGYILQLRDGSLQSRETGGRFSEVRFSRYEVNVDQFAQATARVDPVGSSDTPTLIGAAIAEGGIEDWPRRVITERIGEGFKVIGMCLIVVAISGFPSGRRSRVALPMEVTVLVIAFVELAISSYDVFGPVLGPVGGSIVMIAAGGALLAFRARPRRVPGPRPVDAEMAADMAAAEAEAVRA